MRFEYSIETKRIKKRKTLFIKYSFENWDLKALLKLNESKTSIWYCYEKCSLKKKLIKRGLLIYHSFENWDLRALSKIKEL